MANIRTLKLNLLADTKDFSKGIKQASGQTDSFSGKIKSGMASIAKSAALAGVAVAGMAAAFAVDAVKAAAADQKSQKQLVLALKNTTKATNTQIKAVEKWITKQQFAYGVSDTKLRPALAKLTRVTGDVSKAQDLLSLAMDVAAGTGKDLSTVTDALVKAQNGNLGALRRLGVPLSDTIIKTKDLAAANDLMAKSYGGAAAANADTFSGKLAIFNERIGEAKETIGTAILTAIQPFADKWLPKISKGVTDLIDGFQGKKGNSAGISLGQSIRDLAEALTVLFNSFNTSDDDKLNSLSDNIRAIADAITAVSDALRTFAKYAGYFDKFMNLPLLKYNPVTGAPTYIKNQLTNSGANKTINSAFSDAIDGIKKFIGLTGFKALGGPVTRGRSYIVGEHGPELFTPSGSGVITPNNRLSGGGVTIIMNGIVDAESARLTIERVLQQSSIRTGAINLNGSPI